MKRPTSIPALIITLILVLSLASCSNDPTQVSDSAATTGSGTVDPRGDADFLLASVEAGSSFGRIEIWAHNLTVEPDQVSFDAVMINRTRADIAGPLRLVITELTPPDVEAANPDYVGPDGPVYDFSDDIGEDGVLSETEVSDPVTMVFSWPEPMAFSLGFRVDVGDEAEGFIAGVVFNDLNEDGIYQADIEPGLPGVVVEATPSEREILYRTRTNSRGEYVIDGLDEDIYRVHAQTAPLLFPTTTNPLLVTLVEGADGTVIGLDNVHFGFAETGPPHPIPLFGPVPVGPGSPIGTVFEGTFSVPDFFAEVDLYLTVVPPPLMGPLPLHITMAGVDVNGLPVWRYVCTPDTTCAPSARVLLDPQPAGPNNSIRIEVLGDEHSFLMFSIEAVNARPAP